jgi:hypothetical protein
MDAILIQKLVFWCGIGHFMLCLGSLYVPKALAWSAHLANVRPLLRQMFWTYAAYILVINFGFGFLSVFATAELLNQTFLAKCLTLFIIIYWLARVAIQFFYFDRSDAPQGILYVIGEFALIGLFAIFALSYLLAFLFNGTWL